MRVTAAVVCTLIIFIKAAVVFVYSAKYKKKKVSVAFFAADPELHFQEIALAALCPCLCPVPQHHIFHMLNKRLKGYTCVPKPDHAFIHDYDDNSPLPGPITAD